MKILLIVLIIGLIILASLFISGRAHRALVKAGNRHATLFEVLIFLGSFLLILCALLALLLYNIELGR